jgi:hypothetical protein
LVVDSVNSVEHHSLAVDSDNLVNNKVPVLDKLVLLNKPLNRSLNKPHNPLLNKRTNLSMFSSSFENQN